MVCANLCLVEAEVESVHAGGVFKGFVEVWRSGRLTVALSTHGPCPTAASGAVGWEAFRGQGGVYFPEERAKDGYALYEDGTGDFGAVPNI